MGDDSSITAPLLASETDDSLAKPKAKLSRRWLLGAAFVMFFAANTSASLASPFLPDELSDLDANSSVTGIVFAAYPFSFFFNSLLTGSIMKKNVKRRPILAVLGWIIEGIFTVLSGWSTRIPGITDKTKIWLYFSCQIVQGFGGGMSVTALNALIATVFHDCTGSVFGTLEGIGGLAFTTGPPIGGVLYAAGGFPLPFSIVGGLLLLLLPFLAYVLRHTNLEPHDTESSDTASPSQEKDPLLESKEKGADSTEDGDETMREIEAQRKDADAKVSGAATQEATWLGALSQFDVLLSCFLLFMGQVSLGMLWPTLSKEVEDKLDLEGDAAIIGFLYAIPALCYACSAYPTGTLTDKFGPAKLQFFGATAVAISFCLIGPIHPIYSRVKDSRGALWAFQIVGLVILGIGYCGVSVPSFPSVIGTLSIYGSSGKDLAAALLNAANSIGEGTGPLIGGSLNDIIHFDGLTLFAAGVFVGWILVASARYILLSKYRSIGELCSSE